MKVCLWGEIAKALTGNTQGGGELQVALLAKALAKAGHEVVVIDYGLTDSFTTLDGIKVLPVDGWHKGVRVIRTLTHRIPRFYRALQAQKADIYYCRIRDFRHILGFLASRKVKAKFVMGLASDLDAMSFFMRFKYHHSVSSKSLWSVTNNLLVEFIFPYLLRNADLILVQHIGQKEILKRKNIKSVLFPNLIEQASEKTFMKSKSDSFIYVGSLDKRKGFTDFFKLVSKTPHLHYKVVGTPRDKTGNFYFQKLKTFKNVILLNRLNHEDTLCQISHSRAVISTSPMEGFPNIFIEAWYFGLPVLSLYCDPGNVIEREKLGTVAHGNMLQLIECMNKLDWSIQSRKRATSYVSKQHLLNSSKIEEIDSIFRTLVNY